MVDPYMSQTKVEDTNFPQYEESDNERFQIQDYSKFDYDQFRIKRQLPTKLEELVEKKEYFLVPLYAITAFFAAMLIIGPFLVRRGPHRGIIQSCVMLSAFCMWIFWFTIYFGQMNPLMGPRLENTTVAWIAYKLIAISAAMFGAIMNQVAAFFTFFHSLGIRSHSR